MKDVNEQEFVVGGYTEGEGSRSKTFGGLLVGYYERRRAALRVERRLGFKDTHARRRSYKQLEELRTDESPFVNPPTTIGGRWSGGQAAKCFWVKPELVAQVKFASWTRDGGLRAPVFLGLRDDIDPRTVRREAAGGAASRRRDRATSAPQPSAATADARARVASVLAQLDAATKANFTLEVDGAPIKLTNLDKEFWPATRTSRRARSAT